MPEILTARNLNAKKGMTFLGFKLSRVVFIMLINVKMSPIVGILTFLSMISLSKKSFITSGLVRLVPNLI